MAFELESPAFKQGQKIPAKYSQEGSNISPPLQWSGAPDGTREYVLVCEDPDAPMQPSPHVHWVAYSIPQDLTSLPEAVPQQHALNEPVCLNQGENSDGDLGYDGPLPPKGDGAHHYHFRLYALDTELPAAKGALNKEHLMRMIGDYVLAEAELVGLYERH